MGYWKFAKDYVSAAEALASLVTEAAGCDEACSRCCRIVDVGCGFGESLRFIRRRYPQALPLGVNFDRSEVAVAQESGEHDIVVGDACRLPCSDMSWDMVVAVDSAYHFRPRSAFLHEAARVLKRGGGFAAADLILREPSPRERRRFLGPLRRRLACYLAGIPTENCVSESELRAQLEGAGLGGSINVQDITGDVVGGFSRWLGGRKSWVLNLTGCLLRLIAAEAQFAFVLVSARRRAI